MPAQATAVASRSPPGIGIAVSSEAVDSTARMPTIEVNTVSRPNSAGSYNRVSNG
jgi:hypothetical protein